MFYLYVSHAKSGTSGSDETRRTDEAQEIIASAGTLGAGANYIYSGDFNFNGSTDTSYKAYIASGAGQAHDVANSGGNRTDTSAFQGLLTESATDLLYRDDAQLVSGSVLNGTNGLQLSATSYTAFFNNGSTPIGTSVNSGSNTSFPSLPNRAAVLSGLTTVTDHLPIVADYQFASVATISVSGATSATIITGGTATLGATLTNSAAAGSNNLNYTLSAVVLGGSATLGNPSPSAGTLAAGSSQPCAVAATSTNLGLNTISITASDPNSSNLSQSTTATINVLGHAAPSLSVSSGNNTRVMLGSQATTAGLVLSNGTSGLSGLASLDVNSLGSGVSGPTGGELVASGSALAYTATLSTAASGPQTQTFTLNAGDDHTLPGAFAATNISAGVSVTVVANRVVTASSASFGLVHLGAATSQPVTLSTTGADNDYTRVTVGNAGQDANGISVTGGGDPLLRGVGTGFGGLRAG